MSETDPRPGEQQAIAEEFAGYLRTLDLHDETGQILTAILVNLQHLGRIAPAPGLAETVRDTQNLVESLFYAIRNYVRAAAGGRPAAELPVPDLVPAIAKLAGEFTRRTGIEVRLVLDPDTERVTRAHKTVFYRVVQESLTNVFRHSAAATVTIRSSRSGAGVALEIEDDGASRVPPGRPAPAVPGPVPAAGRPATAFRAAGTIVPSGGTGLRGMRERVRLAGGECTVQMIESRGMSVRVVLPYNVS